MDPVTIDSLAIASTRLRVAGNPKFYADRVHTDSADPADQLVALTGRDPRHHLDGGR